MKNINQNFLIIIMLFVLDSVGINAQWVKIANYEIVFGSQIVNGDNILVGTFDDVYVSTDNGINWTPGGLNTTVRCFAIKGTDIFTGTESGIYLSTNNGASWNSVDSGLINNNVTALASDGNNIFASTYLGFYVSTNNGASWTKISQLSGFTTLNISGNHIYAGTGYGVFLSTDNGKNWTEINNGLPSSFDVMSFEISGNSLFAGLGQGLYVSTNNDNSWTQVNTDLIMVSALTISENYIFAGTWGMGLYFSTDNGLNWTEKSPVRYPSVSAVSVNDNYIFVAVWPSIYRALLSDVTSVEKYPTDLVTNFNLNQNYPNPFNPTTNIGFRIASASGGGFVSLKVYDVLGREVATLVNEEKPAGNYEVEFNGSDLSSGIYFYKLSVSALPSQDRQAGNYSSVKKMILMK